MKQSKLHKMPLFDGMIILFMVLVLVPFTVLVSSSFSSTVTIRANGARPWIQDFSLDAYSVVFMYPVEMLQSYLVSIIVTVAGTVLNVILVATSAFAISRPQFRGKRIVSFYYSFTVMFQVGFVPSYIWFQKYLHIQHLLCFDFNSCVYGWAHDLVARVLFGIARVPLRSREN